MIRLVGHVDAVRRIVTTGADRFDRGVRAQLLREAHYLRGKMVTGMAAQAPGGAAFAPLSPLTLAARKFQGFSGTKALIRTGGLRGGINVVHVPGSSGIGGAVFIGVHRNARAEDGKSLANLADIHEFGRSWTMAFTPKMRRYLFAMLKESGAGGGPATRGADGRFARGKYAGPRNNSNGMIAITIPARPFVRPTIDEHGKPEDVRKRFVYGLSKYMGGDFGTP